MWNVLSYLENVDYNVTNAKTTTSCYYSQTHGEKPGMGIEPIWSGSAGRRFNHSATPAS